MKIRIALAFLLLAACQQPGTSPTHLSLQPPAATAATPAEFPGLHQVVTYAPGLYSGAVPEGEEGFASLSALGVKTIISVDGALPDVAAAKAHGLRYIHLPLGYNGVPPERAKELAKAFESMPGPIYVHCHHGKHRSAGAVAVGGVMTGKFDNAFAVERMKVSGTAPTYTGLYRDAQAAKPMDSATLSGLVCAFPEQSLPTGMVAGMVAIDEFNDQLKEIESAGWKVPAHSPDLVPVSVARQLVEHMSALRTDEHSIQAGAEFIQALDDSVAKGSALQQALELQLANEERTARMKALQASCKACHKHFRD
jgi:protein tyrosine phosphatase (PTP) superfamily phosphohydrolase (DUF442 family)